MGLEYLMTMLFALVLKRRKTLRPFYVTGSKSPGNG